MRGTAPGPGPDRRIYRSYLLRLWQSDVQATWRASLQEVSSGEITHFPSIRSLLAFIALETGTVLRDADDEEEI